MSNKRRRQADASFFVYELGVEVPPDVTHLLVHPSVEVLPEGVFQGLVHLREIVLPEALREIGRCALSGCRSLEHINVPSSLVRIGDCTFSRCELLRTLHLPEGLTEISTNAFCDCTLLKRVCLSSKVTTIGACAFSGCSSLEVVIPIDGVRTIGQYAFWHCLLLQRLRLPSTVARISIGAFQGCSSLKVVILVDGVRTIGPFAFQRCMLEDIVLPSTLTGIGRNAFGQCSSLRMVKLCGGIQMIEGHAFQGCESLNHVVVTPKSLVVTRTGENCTFSFATDGMIVPRADLDRVVIASECFYSMSSAEVSTLEIALTEILGTRFDRGWNEKCEQLRAVLAPHERRRKKEIAGLLELGLRKVDMSRSAKTGLVLDRIRRRWNDKCNWLQALLATREEEAAGLLKIAVQGAEMRRMGEPSTGVGKESPLVLRAGVIIKNVVAFL